MSERSEKKNIPRSGQVAVKLGFITPDQLKEALNEQVDDNLAGRDHRFLGEILCDRNWITLDQLDTLLHELFEEEMRAKGKL